MITPSSKAVPLQPKDVAKTKQAVIPGEVFEAFNELIAASYSSGSATIKQDDVIALVIKKLICTRDDIFVKHWLDVEKVYEQAGWEVYYDKPGHNESYAATFTFSEKDAK